LNHSYCTIKNLTTEIHGLSETITLAEHIRALCSVITKTARVDLETHLKEHSSGITAIEHGVLRHLSHGVTSMAEISRLMGIAPSTLVYVVDGMTKKKLVRRGKDPKDRRKEPLVLEDKGAVLFANTPRMDAGSSLVRSLQKMSASGRAELITLLTALVTDLAGPGRLYLDAEADEAKMPKGRKEAKHKTRRRSE
jgi:DNA-binding MarR family transcriptional regulator